MGDKKWPDTDPPGKYGSLLNLNGTPYIKREVLPGQWQWVEDIDTIKKAAHRSMRRAELIFALRSRPLSSSEMEEVENYGSHILVEPMQTYGEEEIERRFNDLMLTQYKIREASRR